MQETCGGYLDFTSIQVDCITTNHNLSNHDQQQGQEGDEEQEEPPPQHSYSHAIIHKVNNDKKKKNSFFQTKKRALKIASEQLEEVHYASAVSKAMGFLTKVNHNEEMVVHQEPTGDCVERRLVNCDEKKAFIAVDVNPILKNWSTFKATMEDAQIQLALGAPFTGDEKLCGLMISLGAKILVESPVDIDIVKRAEAITTIEDFDNVANSTFSAFVVDTNCNRSSSCIDHSLEAGNNVFFVGDVNGMRAVQQRATSPVRYVVNLSSSALSGEATTMIVEDSIVSLGNFIKADRCGACDADEIFEYAARVGLASEVSGFNVNASDLCDESKLSALVGLFGRLTVEAPVLFINSISEAFFKELSKRDSLKSSLSTLRSCVEGLSVVGEATNFLVGKSHTLVARVIGSRPCVDRETGDVIGRQVYIDDGVYGCLCKPSESDGTLAFSVGLSSTCDISAVKCDETKLSNSTTMTTIWGQTCDSLDKVAVTKLPENVKRGDWLEIPAQNGSSSSTIFNGFSGPNRRYFLSAGQGGTVPTTGSRCTSRFVRLHQSKLEVNVKKMTGTSIVSDFNSSLSVHNEITV